MKNVQTNPWSILFSIGITLAAWIAYNVFIEHQPEAEGRNPFSASIWAVLAMIGGWKWMCGHVLGRGGDAVDEAGRNQ